VYTDRTLMRLHDEVRIYCKVPADEPQVVRSGWINGSGRGDIGIVHQVLVLARKSRTPISEARSGVGVKQYITLPPVST